MLIAGPFGNKNKPSIFYPFSIFNNDFMQDFSASRKICRMSDPFIQIRCFYEWLHNLHNDNITMIF